MSAEPFQRIRLATRAHLERDILQCEHDELTGPLAEADDPFVQQALQELGRRRAALPDRYADEQSVLMLSAALARSHVGVPPSGMAQLTALLRESSPQGDAAADSSVVNGRLDADDPNAHVFYQAADAQPVFLHGLNIKMLLEVGRN